RRLLDNIVEEVVRADPDLLARALSAARRARLGPPPIGEAADALLEERFRLLQAPELILRDQLGGKLSRHPLELSADEIRLLHLARRGATHIRALVGNDLDEALCMQLLERLANRCAADLELAGKRVLAQPLPREHAAA